MTVLHVYAILKTLFGLLMLSCVVVGALYEHDKVPIPLFHKGGYDRVALTNAVGKILWTIGFLGLISTLHW